MVSHESASFNFGGCCIAPRACDASHSFSQLVVWKADRSQNHGFCSNTPPRFFAFVFCLSVSATMAVSAMGDVLGTFLFGSGISRFGDAGLDYYPQESEAGTSGDSSKRYRNPDPVRSIGVSRPRNRLEGSVGQTTRK